MKETDQIKTKLDIVDLVGEYLQLKPAGSGSFKANCPFHQEKTPSFFVSKSKQIWHCFGCGEGGDHFEFIQKIEGMEFPEALEFLAGKAGIELPKFNREAAGIRQKLISINELAAKFYHKVLLESQSAAVARDYIEKRNLNPDIVDLFKLGYAPDKWEALLAFLKKKGYSENDIIQAGLAVRKERGSGCYDRFRNRLMFPIQNHQGKVVGFTARLLDPEAKEAKYVNTPQTKIYNKSEVIYGLDKAKREIQEKDLAIIVEGNMDVISSHQAGVANAIASSGTALTEDQVNLIKRYTENVAFAFDADSAGQAAAKRGIDMALQQGLNVSVITMGEAKDPDELINQGPEKWREAIKNRIGVMKYYFNKAKQDFDLNQARGKKEASHFLLGEISKIKDGVEQTHWIQELSRMIDVNEKVLRESLPKPGQPVKSSPSGSVETNRAEQKSKSDLAAEKLIAILINRPELINNLANSFHPEYITDGSYQQLYKNLVLFYNEPRSSEEHSKGENRHDYAQLIQFLVQQGVTEKGVEHFNALALKGEKDWQEMETEKLKQELLQVSQFIESIYKQELKKTLAKEMREAEERGDKNKVEEILKKFRELE